MTKLQKYLNDRGIKHRYFAELIGVSNATLHNILKSKHLPNIPTAIEIEKKTRGFVTIYDWFEDYQKIHGIKTKSSKTLPE